MPTMNIDHRIQNIITAWLVVKSFLYSSMDIDASSKFMELVEPIGELNINSRLRRIDLFLQVDCSISG